LDLEHLSSNAGAQLLRALGVNGHQEELGRASEEFNGHCLALTLLGSYLTDAYHGEIRCRESIAKRLASDDRQGAHARRVMESYQSWFGEGPELAVLRILGLFDRPVDERAMAALLEPPAIVGLTESLTDLGPSEWRTVLARLRRARLLADEGPRNCGHLDAHPLVREYFGEQLRSRRINAWKECNRRLFDYYRKLAPQFPDSIREMEPLFLAVICGCEAGLFREALHEVYIPRIQRGEASFAARVLGARGALLLVLAHFFTDGHWGSVVQEGAPGQSLSTEDQLFILAQAGLYLTATRGLTSPEARVCYERARPLCVSLDRPRLLYSALIGQWRNSSLTANLAVTMELAKRIYVLAQQQNDPALMVGAYRTLAISHYYSGDFESARQHARRGVQIWHSGGKQSTVEEVHAPVVICLSFQALSEWHLGKQAASQAASADAISLAKDLNDMPALAHALYLSATLAQHDDNCAEVERLASELVELSTRQNFAHFLPLGEILRGWVLAVSGVTAEGIAWIENGIRQYQATGSMVIVPYWLTVKAKALHLANRISDALQAITDAESMIEASGELWWCAELHRLRGVFLATMGADQAEIEASFRAAISTAKVQKSISLEKRAEASHAEYRSQKARVFGRHGLQPEKI
jgi:hypothetical protein